MARFILKASCPVIANQSADWWGNPFLRCLHTDSYGSDIGHCLRMTESRTFCKLLAHKISLTSMVYCKMKE